MEKDDEDTCYFNNLKIIIYFVVKPDQIFFKLGQKIP